MTVDWTWRSAGHCAGMGAKWHALHPDSQKDICWAQGGCPVMAQCWADSQTRYESWAFGTWGGRKESERRGMAFFDELPKKGLPLPRRDSAPDRSRGQSRQTVESRLPRGRVR